MPQALPERLGVVILQLAGALVRMFFVVLLVATPSLILPGVTSDGAQIIVLISIFAAALVLFEYASAYPGLVEFRDAPPFNRIRFASLWVTVILLSLLVRHTMEPSAVTGVVLDVGMRVGDVVDFAYSPVRLVVSMLPADTNPIHAELVRNASGLAYLISIVTLGVFIILQRLFRWPLRSGTFNVWVNLPTFDPTAGGDVVSRLERDARFNIALGFLLPFLTPAVITSATSLFGAVSLGNPHTLIWTVAAWAFLPASLFMRGIAMARIAGMITDMRLVSRHAEDGNEGLLPA